MSLLWVNFNFNCIIHLIVRILNLKRWIWQLMQLFWRFLTLRGYSAISVFLGKSGFYDFESKHYICQFTSLDFHIIRGRFLYLPSGKFTLRFHPRILLKIWYFPRWVEQSPPGYWERVYLKQVFVFYNPKIWLKF